MTPVEVPFRLLRCDDLPATHPFNLAYAFGVQDTKQAIVPGTRQPAGTLAFDFSLTAEAGKDPEYPVFTGRFASGPVHDRFVYLSWRAIQRGDDINRVKARLSPITWSMVQRSREQGRPLTADMTGWSPSDPRKFVVWSLG